MIIIVVAVAFLSACGPRTWTTADTAMQVAVTAAFVADYSQTRAALASDGIEVNPIIGPTGERVVPETYFYLCAYGSAVAAYAIRKPWRNLFQGAVLAIQVRTVSRNWQAGYAVQF